MFVLCRSGNILMFFEFLFVDEWLLDDECLLVKINLISLMIFLIEIL